MADKDLTRIAALLRKAESTDNEHEADAYLQAAQRLATLSAVDIALARAHSEHRERRCEGGRGGAGTGDRTRGALPGELHGARELDRYPSDQRLLRSIAAGGRPGRPARPARRRTIDRRRTARDRRWFVTARP